MQPGQAAQHGHQTIRLQSHPWIAKILRRLLLHAELLLLVAKDHRSRPPMSPVATTRARMAQMKTEGVGGDHRCPYAHHLPDPHGLDPHYCHHPRRPCAELHGLRHARLITLPGIDSDEWKCHFQMDGLLTFMRRECVNFSTRSTVSRNCVFGYS